MPFHNTFIYPFIKLQSFAFTHSIKLRLFNVSPRILVRITSAFSGSPKHLDIPYNDEEFLLLD
jgi:hypothetical protein